MTRAELHDFIKSQLCVIVGLFDQKNQAYGNGDDAFYNFTETAKRIYGSAGLDAAFRVLLAYMDKHMIALANTGIDDFEAAERLKDIVVYALIGLAMAKEARNTQKFEELEEEDLEKAKRA